MVFGTSTSTTSDLIRRTLAHGQAQMRQAVNQLAQPFTSMQTTMVMQFPVDGAQVGQAIEVDWTLYRVVDVNTGSKTLSVVPEIDAEDHASGAKVLLRPRFPARTVINTINEDLADLSMQGIYRLETVQGGPNGEPPDVPLGAIEVLAVWSKEAGLDPRPLPTGEYRIADTPTGRVLRGPSTVEYVTFGCMMNPLPLNDDVVVTDTTGIPATALDLPPLGAAMVLLGDRESARNIINAQGETRRAEEVPPGANSSQMRTWAITRQQRIVSEAARFIQRYGYIREVSPYYG